MSERNENILRVLHIEDLEDDFLLVKRALRETWREIDATWTDTVEGIERAFAEREFDVALSDFSMPTLDGFEALEVVRRLAPELPFIVVSGEVGEETAVEAMRRGANDYVMKSHLKRLGPAVEREIRDATVRRQKREAERVRRESERRFRDVFERSLDVILLVDAESGAIIDVNSAAKRVWGYDPADLIGKSFEEITPPSSSLKREDFAADLVARGDALETYGFLKADESVCPMELTASMFPSREGKTLLVTLRDITERRKAERELAESRERIRKMNEDLERRVVERTSQLEKANRQLNEEIAVRKRAEEEAKRALERERELNALKSRFVSMVSHEYHTPITAVRSSADMILRYDDVWSEERKREHIHRIAASAKQMQELVNDVLYIGRSDAGTLRLEPREMNLPSYLRKLSEETLFTLRTDHAFDFTFTGDEDIVGDEKSLRQILSNLFSNAVKYSPEGKRVAVTARVDDEEVVVVVADEGIGMTPEDLGKAFDSFHRGSNVGAIPGTGLGLAIVVRSVEALGGTITVSSAPGEGSTFTARFPRFLQATQASDPRKEAI
jgi:PAS domain S-box-containing protein